MGRGVSTGAMARWASASIVSVSMNRLLVLLSVLSACNLVPAVSDDAGKDAAIGGDDGGDDACASLSCDAPPQSICDGSAVRQFDVQGTCIDGTCVYSATSTPCAMGCIDGQCVIDGCAQVSCTNPPPPTCASATSRRVADAGVCLAADGGCSYPLVDESCPQGQNCVDGRCVTGSPLCSAANCGGCCQADSCLLPSAQSTMSCGKGGMLCLACSTGYECMTGMCRDINECATNNGGCASNATCTNVAGGRMCACPGGYVGDGVTCTAPSRWKERAQGNVLVNRYYAMTYDSVRERVILDGRGETWEWNGAMWRQVAMTGPRPSTRIWHQLAFDPLRNRTVLFGGDAIGASATHDDTWEYNGTTWMRITTNSAPSPRSRYGFAFDPGRRKVLLTSGRGVSVFDLWEWNGISWTQVVTTNPLNQAPRSRYAHAMAYDENRQRMVVFGGEYGPNNQLDDTWELVGSTWQRVGMVGPPSARAYMSLVYDRRLKQVVLFGGVQGALGASPIAALRDTWLWNGAQWRLDTATARPSARVGYGLAYDSKREQIVLYGGVSPNNTELSDTWEYGP